MKKIFLSLLTTSTLFAASPAFAMEDSPEQEKLKTLIIKKKQYEVAFWLTNKQSLYGWVAAARTPEDQRMFWGTTDFGETEKKVQALKKWAEYPEENFQLFVTDYRDETYTPVSQLREYLKNCNTRIQALMSHGFDEATFEDSLFAQKVKELTASEKYQNRQAEYVQRLKPLLRQQKICELATYGPMKRYGLQEWGAFPDVAFHSRVRELTGTDQLATEWEGVNQQINKLKSDFPEMTFAPQCSDSTLKSLLWKEVDSSAYLARKTAYQTTLEQLVTEKMAIKVTMWNKEASPNEYPAVYDLNFVKFVDMEFTSPSKEHSLRQLKQEIQTDMPQGTQGQRAEWNKHVLELACEAEDPSFKAWEHCQDPFFLENLVILRKQPAAQLPRYLDKNKQDAKKLKAQYPEMANLREFSKQKFQRNLLHKIMTETVTLAQDQGKERDK